MSGTWPSPVTIDDEDPAGTCRVTMTIPKLKTAMFGKGNYQLNDDPFKPDSVCMRVTVDGETYEYSKKMPEDINPDKSKVKCKDGKVVLTLQKVQRGSWSDHVKFLIKKE